MARRGAARSPRMTLKVGSESDPQRTLASRFGGADGSAADRSGFGWTDANPLELLDAIAGVTGAGDAIVFSRTSDGGALVVSVLSGNDRRKFYPDSADAIGHALRQIAAAYLGVGEVDPTTRERRKT
jgi:hypothetical protein